MAGGDRRERRERRERRPAPALDPTTLDRLALDYVARYATTRAKLAAYLRRKLRERGWDAGEQPDLQAIAARMAASGFVDDAAFAVARAASLGRRGYGVRRVAQDLAVAGIDDADRGEALDRSVAGAWEAALAYARRRRIGPYAQDAAEGEAVRRALAAMVRAGHDYAVARRIVSAAPGYLPEPIED